MSREIPHILLVEDSPDDAFFLLRLARKEKVTITHVRDGEQAKEALTGTGEPGARRPSLIVTDLKMPRCDGIEFMSWLRSAPATASIPVVVLSTSGMQMDRERAQEAGASEYLVKPPGALEYESVWTAILRVANAQIRAARRAGTSF